MTIPAHRPAAATYVEIWLATGVRFDDRNAFTRNQQLGARVVVPTERDEDRAVHGLWKFQLTSDPLRPEIVVCLAAALNVRPKADDMTVTYSYEEIK